jgi:uncharacterized membrane protein
MFMNNIFPFLYMACFLIAMILILNMVSQAFKRGFLWGVLCLLFPAGTYVYCKRHWQITKTLAIPTLILLVSGVVFKLVIMAAQ